MSLLFNMPSRLVINFLPKSKRLLISWLQSPSAVIFEPQKVKSLFPLFPHLFAMNWWDQMPWSYFSECWVLSQLFHSPLSLSSRSSLVLHLLLSRYKLSGSWAEDTLRESSGICVVLRSLDCKPWLVSHWERFPERSPSAHWARGHTGIRTCPFGHLTLHTCVVRKKRMEMS